MHPAHCLLPRWHSLTSWDLPKETWIHSFPCIHSFTHSLTHQTTSPFWSCSPEATQCSEGDRALTRNLHGWTLLEASRGCGSETQGGGKSMLMGELGDVLHRGSQS